MLRNFVIYDDNKTSIKKKTNPSNIPGIKNEVFRYIRSVKKLDSREKIFIKNVFVEVMLLFLDWKRV